MKDITPEMIELIKKPLPPEAITQHPTKTYLSSIKAIYVTERLNEVFGIGAWIIKTEKIVDGLKGMVVVKVTFEIPLYGIYYESFGGNDNGGEASKNFDLGDAYKGATTDAITKIASYIGIGIDVFKGKQKQGTLPKQEPIKSEDPVKEKPKFGDANYQGFIQKMDSYKTYEEAIEKIESVYDIDNHYKEQIKLLYTNF